MTTGYQREIKGGPRVSATSKLERFVIIVNGFQPLTIITKRYILGVATALDPPLEIKLYRRARKKKNLTLKKRRRIQNPVKHLRWSNLRKYLMAISC